jgi:hypothetical protein
MGRLLQPFARPDWWTAIFTGLLATVTAGALWYAHQQISASHEEAQVQHLLELDQRYSQEPMITYRKLYAQKRLKGDEASPERDKLLDFFETVAVLMNRGYLNETDVWETFGKDVFPLFADARDTIELDREDDPLGYSNLVSLVGRLELIEIARHGTEYKPSKDDITGYWKDEAAIGPGIPTEHRRHLPSTK